MSKKSNQEDASRGWSEEPPSWIEDAAAVRLELREAIHSGHETLRDMRRERRELERLRREAADNVNNLAFDAMRERLAEVVRGVERGFQDVLQEARREVLRDLSRLVHVELDRLNDRIINDWRSGRPIRDIFLPPTRPKDR